MGLSPEGSGGAEDDRGSYRDIIRSRPGVLMSLMEMAAGSDDRVLVRNIVEAALYIFSGSEDDLPGGREYWERMRQTAPGQGGYALSPENARARELRAFDVFKRELERHSPGLQARPPEAASEATGSAENVSRAAATPPPPPAPSGETATLLRAIPAPEDDHRPVADRPGGRDDILGIKKLEERLALQEEDARMAREDLANMEKKYRENIELLKAEAHDRGELQKRITAAEGDASRARERLGQEEKNAREARQRLEKKEAELEKLGDQLHGLQLELVKKEEEIRMAMDHLRGEEQERRRVLEALRQEAREKAQMEHRLKKREQELERLEARIQDEEKRVESLKGSQAVSEEQSRLRSEELRRREDDVRALEAGTRERVMVLERDEDILKKRISDLKQELRTGQTMEARLQKREEMRAALEARYRAKEEELVKELMELERAKVLVAERERELSGQRASAGEQDATQPPAEANIAPATSPADAALAPSVQAEASPPSIPAPPAQPPAPPLDTSTRNNVLDLLSRRIKKI